MRTPDKVGVGRAWRVILEPRTLDQTATLACWLVHCPGAHPFWDHWLIACIHLREIEGVAPPAKDYPEAEFELMVAALDPKSDLDPDRCNWQVLTPLDVHEQFHGVSDEIAQHIAEMFVNVVVSGKLSPDRDYRSVWRTMLRNTVDHYLTEHGVPN
jgi:hypothetical protein